MNVTLDAIVQLLELAILIFLLVRNVGLRGRLKRLQERLDRGT